MSKAPGPPGVKPGALDTHSGSEQARSIKHTLDVFRQARNRPAADGSGRKEAIGVIVEFKLRMIGFAGHVADVQWSVVSPSGTPLPQAWQRNREGKRFTARSPDDEQVGSFWAPLPKQTGRYHIHLRVVDDHNVQREYADTPAFS